MRERGSREWSREWRGGVKQRERRRGRGRDSEAEGEVARRREEKG